MGISHAYTQTVADGTATSVVRPSDWNSGHILVQQISGNTAGVSSISGTNLVWAGGNNVTLSANGSTVSIIGAAGGGAQTTQTQPAGNIAGVGFTSTTTVGAAVTAALGTNGLSMAVPNYLTTYVAQTTQTQPAGNIAGVGTTFAGTNATATIGLNSNGLALSLSAGGGGGGGSLNVSAGTTSNNLTNLVFSNSNGLSFGLNGSTITGSYTTPTQSVQTQAAGNIAGTGFTSTTTAGVAITAALGTNGLSMAVPNFITTYAAQTTQTQNLHNVTLSGNTSGTLAQISSGTMTLAGGNNIVLSQVGNAITISGSNQSVQTQASGNIAGTGYTSTTQAGTTVGLTHNTAGLSMAWPPFITTYAAQTTQTQPAGNIAGVGTTFGGTNVSGSMTLNSNGLALSLSAPTPGGGGAINFSAGTASGNLQTVVFADSNNISFGLNGSTITGQVKANQVSFFNAQATGGYSTASTATSTTVTAVNPLGFGDPRDNIWFEQSVDIFGQQNIVIVGPQFQDNGNVSWTTARNAGASNKITNIVNAIAPIKLSAGTVSTTATSYLFSNSPTVSFGLNGGTITASAAGGGTSNDDHFYPFFPPGAQSTFIPLANNTIYLREFDVENPTQFVRVVNYSSFSSLTSTFSVSGIVSATNSGSGAATVGTRMTHYWLNKSGNPGQSGYDIYYTVSQANNEIGAGMTVSVTQSTNASSCTVSYSTTVGIFFPISIGSNGNVTYTTLTTGGNGNFSTTSTGLSTFSSSFGNTSIWRQFSGLRPVFSPAPGSTLQTMAAGEVIYGLLVNTTSGTTGSYTLTRIPNLAFSNVVYTTSASYIEIGGSATSNFISTNIYGGGYGSITGNSTASITNATGFNESIVNNMGSNASLWVALQNYGYSLTATTL